MPASVAAFHESLFLLSGGVMEDIDVSCVDSMEKVDRGRMGFNRPARRDPQHLPLPEGDRKIRNQRLPLNQSKKKGRRRPLKSLSCLARLPRLNTRSLPLHCTRWKQNSR